jgi:hypothetical protein
MVIVGYTQKYWFFIKRNLLFAIDHFFFLSKTNFNHFFLLGMVKLGKVSVNKAIKIYLLLKKELSLRQHTNGKIKEFLWDQRYRSRARFSINGREN